MKMRLLLRNQYLLKIAAMVPIKKCSFLAKIKANIYEHLLLELSFESIFDKI